MVLHQPEHNAQISIQDGIEMAPLTLQLGGPGEFHLVNQSDLALIWNRDFLVYLCLFY